MPHGVEFIPHRSAHAPDREDCVGQTCTPLCLYIPKQLGMHASSWVPVVEAYEVCRRERYCC